MWFRKKKQTETKIVTVDPPVINLMERLIAAMSGSRSVTSYSSPIAMTLPFQAQHVETPEEAEQHKKEITEVDAFISTMGPDIKTQTEALIKEEIRDMLLLGGNRPRILELLRAGKTPRIIRKKEGRRDPLFLQFGDGITQPIEEMQILG